MQRLLKLFFSTAMLFMLAVGCSAAGSKESQNENKEESNNKEEAKQEEKDGPVNEEVLVDRLIQEMNENKDTLLKDGNHFITILDRNELYYYQDSSIGEEEDRIEVRTSLGESEPEFYGDTEAYELNSGVPGEIGEIDDGYISFISSTVDKETEILLGELSIEEGKKTLDRLEFRDEEITEADVKEMIGFDYEDVHYFDNKDTKYNNITEVFMRAGLTRSIGVRYRNHDAGEYDAVDVHISKEAFPRDSNIEPETTKTEEGKKVEIVDNGLYVDWYWEQDGYYYNISGNYSEEDEDKKEYNLEVIDNITKAYGE